VERRSGGAKGETHAKKELSTYARSLALQLFKEYDRHISGNCLWTKSGVFLRVLVLVSWGADCTAHPASELLRL